MKKIILIIMLIITSMLMANTYTVKQNGTGDFTTIQAAINFVDNDDKIIVYEGTYNEQIYFLGKNIVVESRYPTTGNEWYIDNTIISFQSNPFLGVVNFSNGEIYTELIGFTIQDGFIGVNIVNCDSPKIQNCIITENTRGIFIRLAGGPTFLHPNIIDNVIINNEVVGIFCADDTYPDITNNLIKNNTVGIIANGIDIAGEERTCFPTISNNIFENNDEGIQAEYAHSEINGNLFMNNQYVFHLGGFTNNLQINNCTIYENHQLIAGALGGLAITNSIIRNLIVSIPQYLQINYSNIEGGYAGTGNIDEDPLFETVGDNEYCLTWDSDDFSPCIDTGDPNSSLDPDGTRADMGAYYKEHEVKNYSLPNGWTWLSFDILDIYQPFTTNQVQNLLDDIKSNLHHGEHEGITFEYNAPFWSNGTHLITSPKGYKIKMNTADDITVSGFRCDPAISINLYANAPDGNWIGYFLEETQLVYDAFAGYLDNISVIKAQSWGIQKVNGVWPQLFAAYTLSPGDMVIVYCERDISDFCWSFEEPQEKYIVPKSQDFTYTEEADYIPIFISLDPEDMPSEIGAYVEGECKGATVVQDTTTQICAYILENQGETLEFEFSYGGRGVNTRFSEYIVFDPETGYRETTTIDLREKQKSYYVSFKSSNENETGNLPLLLSSSNYPNPFNPTTTIAYSLPDDGMIELRVFNIRGQLVKTLVKGEQLAGSYETVWNGKDNNEKSVSSGIYFYKLSTKDETIMKKMLMLK